MRVKICGITQPEQGQAIAQLGATALGFICVPQSPRYVNPAQIRAIVTQLPLNSLGQPTVDRIGVFVDTSIEDMMAVVAIASLNAIQLHGSEPPQLCQALRAALPQVEIIKALRVRDRESLRQIEQYEGTVDALLLDAYSPNAAHPGLYGGTGHQLDWSWPELQAFRPGCPWLLAGGITPENVLRAIGQLSPDGIDVSSGVEIAPGHKDLAKVDELLKQLRLKP